MDTPLSARTTFSLLQHKNALVCEGSCLHNTAMGYETLPPSPLFPPNCHPRRKIVMCPPWLRDRAADPGYLGAVLACPGSLTASAVSNSGLPSLSQASTGR